MGLAFKPKERLSVSISQTVTCKITCRKSHRRNTKRDTQRHVLLWKYSRESRWHIPLWTALFPNDWLIQMSEPWRVESLWDLDETWFGPALKTDKSFPSHCDVKTSYQYRPVLVLWGTMTVLSACLHWHRFLCHGYKVYESSSPTHTHTHTQCYGQLAEHKADCVEGNNSESLG